MDIIIKIHRKQEGKEMKMLQRNKLCDSNFGQVAVEFDFKTPSFFQPLFLPLY